MQNGTNNNLNDVLRNIEACGSKLDRWNSKKWENMRKDIKTRRLVVSLANRDTSEMNWKQVGKLKDQLNDSLKVEEMYWRQRSKTDWLQKGDMNSRFFHQKASARRI
ncbi:hypothetical protein Ddye_006655 [Dipteronia dyeriana]|uniref:Uncharacterized protein n=1 Tax=Dipteronia dyeriana TaxID=168575 RepID=A0AAD9XJ24_9ROSI|nr:hypothetical protein Ddye_006655 [Dipteronia dyeriana]